MKKKLLYQVWSPSTRFPSQYVPFDYIVFSSRRAAVAHQITIESAFRCPTFIHALELV